MKRERNIFEKLSTRRIATWILFLSQAYIAPQAYAHVSTNTQVGCVEKTLESKLQSHPAVVAAERERAIRLLQERKTNVAYPHVPGVEQISISDRPPIHNWDKPLPLSVGASDPIIEMAREIRLVDDFKELSDLVPKKSHPISVSEQKKLLTLLSSGTLDLKGKRSLLGDYIHTHYEKASELRPAQGLANARWQLKTSSAKIRDAFQYTENTWSKLLREPHPVEGGSLIPSPYPVLTPAGRFQEAYYWDTYFSNMGLLATGRLDIAQMQVENFLSYIRKYGFIPNGGRDYYLSRSQPPFISSMVREVYEESLKKASSPAEKERLKRWLRDRAYPLIKLDYERFWMNPKTRYDAKTGLNHHWDDINLPRPERHGADNELALGETYQDVRAGAESGLDFTDVAKGQDGHAAGPLLNSMLFKTEQDLAWFARKLSIDGDAKKFQKAADHRKAAINKYLWNPVKGRYETFLLKTGQRSGAVSADTFAPLFVGASDPEQASKVRSQLKILEKGGGIMASELVHSVHQWDGTNGWAPFQVMAIQGLNNYGFHKDAYRIADKWVNAIAQIHSESRTFYERIDVDKVQKPAVDEHKYPTQEGFAWTNGSFQWAATKILNIPLSPVAH